MNRLSRREALLALAAGGGFASTTVASVDVQEPDSADIGPLWPGEPPGGAASLPPEQVIERPHPQGLRDRIVRGVRTPLLTLFRAAAPRGSAVLIVPGGSYKHVVIDKEGFETARWLASSGVTAAVLRYRLPGDGWLAGADAPLQDAQRALRLLQSRAVSLGVEAPRIGVLGFSAGGHLAARLAFESAQPAYAPIDAADRGVPRPAWAALLYPVITMLPPDAHATSRQRLLGVAPDAARVARYSVENAVRADAPPTFIVHAADDADVPVGNSLRLHAALRAAGIETEAHLFARGGHGFGLRNIAGRPVAAWPDLLQRWAARWL